MKHKKWAIYFMFMMLSFIGATIGYYQLYNEAVDKIAMLENNLMACEGIRK